ncbi:MAG: sulfotransferase domain-containing protein [Sulfurimonadaceae bacterium]
MKKIAIHSVPRSGSSWIGQIFNSSPDVNFKFQPLFSYAFKDYLNTSSSLKDINTFFEEIAQSSDPFLLQQDKIDKGNYPVFQKNDNPIHIVYKEVRYHHILENMLTVDPDVIVIGIVRSPYAVINSFLNAPREFRKDLGWDELSEWQYAQKKNLDKPEEFYGYEKWKEVVLLFHKLQEQYPNRFCLIKYDDLLTHTLEEVEKNFSFCSIQITDQTKRFLKQSTKINQDDTYSVYKSKTADDSWKKRLNPLIVDAISNDLKKNNLDEYLE